MCENEQEIVLKEFKVALADAITEWASLEDALALLLSILIDRETQYGLALYFTPVAAETRLQLVDSAVEAFLRSRLPDAILLFCWRKIVEKIGRKRKIRNKLAHGAINRISKNGLHTVRLTNPIFQQLKTRRPDQLPGMSLNDVQEATKSFRHCITAVSTVSELVQMLFATRPMLGRFQETLLLLEKFLLTSDPQMELQKLADLPTPSRQFQVSS